jgi:hypothetical protein
MNVIRIIIHVAGLALCASMALSQLGQTGVPFLLISPSAEMNGRGEVSVSVVTDDPLAVSTNPAHLGMLGLGNYASAGFNYAPWLPVFQQSDLWYRSFAFNAGMNISGATAGVPDVGIGLAYSRAYLNLGRASVPLEDPSGSETIDAYEASDQFSLGLGVDAVVRASAGFTVKHLVSHLVFGGITGNARSGEAKAFAYDLGLLVDVPVVGILSHYGVARIEILPSWRPVVNVSFGFANNNLGRNSIVYFDAAQAEPLPRYARAGITLSGAIDHEVGDLVFRPLSFSWTIESNDILVRRTPAVLDSLGHMISGSSWEYWSGTGGIKVFEELILGHFNRETVKKRGLELGLGEFFIARWGRFEEDRLTGGRQFRTSGYGLRLGGILKLIRALNTDLTSSPVMDFLLRHLDVRYDESRIATIENGSPLDGTTFRAGSITLSNQCR